MQLAYPSHSLPLPTGTVTTPYFKLELLLIQEIEEDVFKQTRLDVLHR